MRQQQSLFLWIILCNWPKRWKMEKVSPGQQQSLFLWIILCNLECQRSYITCKESSNPCFCGSYFATHNTFGKIQKSDEYRSNPCFCGSYFATKTMAEFKKIVEEIQQQSLFLWIILCNKAIDKKLGYERTPVAILVFVDHTLQRNEDNDIQVRLLSWQQSLFLWIILCNLKQKTISIINGKTSSNPCFCGSYFATDLIGMERYFANQQQSLFLWIILCNSAKIG